MTLRLRHNIDTSSLKYVDALSGSEEMQANLQQSMRAVYSALPFVLVGCKSDLQLQPEPSTNVADEGALMQLDMEQRALRSFSVSTYTAEPNNRKRVEHLFDFIIKRVIESPLEGRIPGETHYDRIKRIEAAAFSKEMDPLVVTKVKAVYDFTASEPGDLAFKEGDIISVLESRYEQWWKGTLHGEIGLFPTNYVKPWERIHASSA